MTSQKAKFTIKRITPPAKEDDLEDTLARYRELRLDCLQKEAQWFSSHHSDEVAFTRADWEARVLNPLAICYAVIIDSACSVDNTDFPSGTWIGFLTAIGPFEFAGDNASSSKVSPYLEAVTGFLAGLSKYEGFQGGHYHAVSMYVKSEFRKLGLGAMLIRSVLNEIRVRLSFENPAAVVSLVVEANNLAAQKAYTKAGFAESEAFDLGQLLSEVNKRRGIDREEKEIMSLLMDTRVTYSDSHDTTDTGVKEPNH